MCPTQSPVQGPPTSGGPRISFAITEVSANCGKLVRPRDWMNEWMNGCEHTHASKDATGHHSLLATRTRSRTRSQTGLMSIALYWPVRMAATTAKKGKGVGGVRTRLGDTLNAYRGLAQQTRRRRTFLITQRRRERRQRVNFNLWLCI